MPRKKQSPAPPTSGPQPAAARSKPAQILTPAATPAALRKPQPPASPLAHFGLVPLKPAAARSDARNEETKSTPRTHRELAEAIFAQCDPVAVGRELLESGGSDRGGSVKARMWERLVEFLLGKPSAPPKEETLEIIWDLPGPPRDPEES